MRFVLLPILLAATMAPSAAASNAKAPDPQAIAALEERASHANPREQCFLYARIIHEKIELAALQLHAGQQENAALTLTAARTYAQKIHASVDEDNRRLKDAEILLRHATFRLREMLHSSALDARPPLEATLAQLDQVQEEALTQVFRK